MSLPAYAFNQSAFPEMYERWLVGALFRPWAEDLIRRAGVSAGEHVLDVACGTGIVARLANERVGHNGRVVGVDLSQPMLDVAAKIAPTIDWRPGDAQALPIADGESFDVVFCQQGLQFVPDKPQAVREMRRALRPGGRLAVAIWSPVEMCPLFYELQLAAEKQLSTIVDQRFGFGDAAALEQLLVDAGLRNLHLETTSRTAELENAELFVRMNAMALVGMSPQAKELSEDERTRIVSSLEQDGQVRVARFVVGERLACQMQANVVTARR